MGRGGGGLRARPPGHPPGQAPPGAGDRPGSALRAGHGGRARQVVPSGYGLVPPEARGAPEAEAEPGGRRGPVQAGGGPFWEGEGPLPPGGLRQEPALGPGGGAARVPRVGAGPRAGAVELRKVKNHFIFTIESTGVLPPWELLKEALRILSAKCTRVSALVESV